MANLRINIDFDNTVTEYSDDPITSIQPNEITGSTSYLFPTSQHAFLYRWNGSDVEQNTLFNQEQYLSSILELSGLRLFQVLCSSGETNVNTIGKTPIEFDAITDPSNAISGVVPSTSGFTVEYRGQYQIGANIVIKTDSDLLHTIGFQFTINDDPVLENVYVSTTVDRNSTASVSIAPVDIGILEIGDVLNLKGFTINGDTTPEVKISLNGATFRIIRIGD